jgi:putative membrane protein
MTADALTDSLKPRVLEVELAHDRLPVREPQVTLTEFTERIHPVQPARSVSAAPAAAPHRDRSIGLGVAGIGAFVVLWVAIDTIGWVSAAFDHSTALGLLSAVAVVAGLGGAAAVIAREVTSLFRLKSVEAIQERFRCGLDQLRRTEMQQAIACILAVAPRDGGVAQAIESFQRQARAHHTAAQQVAILARTVIAPLDRRAEAHVRTAVLRAFGITAISPTALSDAVFFLACGLRMVRAIASSYGHRPTAAATVHLLRRLVLEAGKLGAVDVASASLVQHLGGAVAERFASSAAEAVYAAYRMARLGIIVMELCRPIPFGDDEVPSVTSLVASVVRQRKEEGKSGAGAALGRQGHPASS